MTLDNGEVYITQDTDEQRVSQTPVTAAIVAALVPATDPEESDLRHVDEEIDRAGLEGVLSEKKEEQRLSTEGYGVTVDSSGVFCRAVTGGSLCRYKSPDIFGAHRLGVGLRTS